MAWKAGALLAKQLLYATNISQLLQGQKEWSLRLPSRSLFMSCTTLTTENNPLAFMDTELKMITHVKSNNCGVPPVWIMVRKVCYITSKVSSVLQKYTDFVFSEFCAYLQHLCTPSLVFIMLHDKAKKALQNFHCYYDDIRRYTCAKDNNCSFCKCYKAASSYSGLLTCAKGRST